MHRWFDIEYTKTRVFCRHSSLIKYALSTATEERVYCFESLELVTPSSGIDPGPWTSGGVIKLYILHTACAMIIFLFSIQFAQRPKSFAFDESKFGLLICILLFSVRARTHGVTKSSSRVHQCPWLCCVFVLNTMCISIQLTV